MPGLRHVTVVEAVELADPHVGMPATRIMRQK